MQERILGPINGYFVAVTALVTGEMADHYLGVAKLCASQPQSYFDAEAVLAFECPATHSRVEEALDCAEDLAVDSATQASPVNSVELPGPLWALAYVSKTHRVIANAEVERLLQSARRRNAERGITGILLSFDECFMQYIEGPRPHLELVYRTIRKDPMHTGLIELLKAEIAERAFPDWAMVYESPAAALWSASGAPINRDPQRVQADQVRSMLNLFLQRHGARDELVRTVQDRFSST